LLKRVPVTGVAPIVAALNYLAPGCAAVRTWACAPPAGQPRFNGRLQAYPMLIEDMRSLREPARLDTQGFALCARRSAVCDFWDEDELRAVYYAEAQRLLCELTGASRALVFDHTLRRRASGRPPLDGTGGSFAAVREPVGRVHADFTPESATARLRRQIGDEEAGPLMDRRFAVFGLWRPTRTEPVRDAPLAVCDTRSVSPADLVCNELIYADRRGETYIGRHNPAHRWFHVSNQTRDEVIVFKSFDSARADVTLHTAFEHPQTPPDAPLRESVELRAFAFYS
jgi:hypothetical protein